MSTSYATLTDLPKSSHYLYIYVTATQVDLSYDGDIIDTEATGWVDWDWDPEILHESKSDVRPIRTASILDVDPDDEDMDTWAKVITDAWIEVTRQVGSVSEEEVGYAVDDAYSPPTSSLSTMHMLHVELTEGPMHMPALSWDVTGLPTA